MQADQVEDFDLLASANHQSLDQVSAVEFDFSLSHTRQVQALRRWRPTDTPPTDQCAPSRQDATDRPQRGNLLQRKLSRMFDQLASNCRSFKLAERTGRLQLAADFQDHVFNRRRSGLRDESPNARTIAPIHAIQPLVARQRHPDRSPKSPPAIPTNGDAGCSRSSARTLVADTVAAPSNSFEPH